jgi:hypothetical protein
MGSPIMNHCPQLGPVSILRWVGQPGFAAGAAMTVCGRMQVRNNKVVSKKRLLGMVASSK